MTGTLRQLRSVQVGPVRRLERGGRRLSSAMVKAPVAGPVPVGPLGLLGDAQADLRFHGGPDRAVYAYPAEHYDFWRQARQAAGVDGIDDRLPPGSLGENLTLAGLLEAEVWLGDRLCFPHCTLEVTGPREPCHKLNLALGLPQAVRLMAESGHCGFYLAVREPGTLAAGEAFELRPGPRRQALPEVFRARSARHLRGPG